MSPEDLGIAFAKLDSTAQVVFLQAAVNESKTWDKAGSGHAQWSYIGSELRKKEHSEAREMVEIIAHMAAYHPATPIPEPEPTPEPPKPIDLMEPWNDG